PAEELSRLADGQVADVDDLLHFAACLGQDLAVLEADQAGEVLLARAEAVAQAANDLSAQRSRHQTPSRESLVRGPDRCLDLSGRGGLDVGEHLGGGGVVAFDRRAARVLLELSAVGNAADRVLGAYAERAQDLADLCGPTADGLGAHLIDLLPSNDVQFR